VIRYLSIQETEHPLRSEMDPLSIAEVLQGIMNDEDWMSLEEIEMAQDLLFDRIAAEKQTVEGSLAIN